MFVRSGNAVTTPVGGELTQIPRTFEQAVFNLNPGVRPIGYSLGGWLGVELGGYTNR